MPVRPARPDDLPAVSRLAAELVRYHHRVDPARFFLPERVEEGYERWLRAELANPQAVVLVAEETDEICGYAYGRLEPRDWNALLDAHGGLHDVFVAPPARRRGVARALVEGMVAALSALGAPRVVLTTMPQNAAGRALFVALGFRETMIEMTREGR